MGIIGRVGPIVLALSIHGEALAQRNTCGNVGTAPNIVTSTIASPPALDGSGNAPGTWTPEAGRFETHGVEYVSGEGVQLQILTDGCTDIQSIQIGTNVLTPSMSGSGTLPNYYYYSSIDTQNNSSGHGYSIWIGFPALADGTTENVVVTFVRSFGTATATYAFQLVHVARVQPVNTDSPIGISSTEIHNLFATALNNEFSGPDHSVVVNHTRLYAYDPASLGTYIDAAGIWFDFAFKADVPCKPRVRIVGTFAIDTNAPGHVGLSTRWVNPATASPDIGWCEVAEAVLGAITDGLLGYSGPVANVQDVIGKQIDQALMNAAPNGASLFLDGTLTHWDELLINLKLPFPSVEIDAPYDAFDMARTPAYFPPGQTVGLFASSVGMHDIAARPTPPRLIPSGPNGVPLDTPQALSNAYTFLRSGGLVDDTAAVGQLLARFPRLTVGPFETSDFQYTPGCALTVPNSKLPVVSPAIRFGVNDTTADAQRLRASAAQGYKIRVVFGFPGPPCAVFTRPITSK